MKLTIILIPLLFFMTSCTIDWNDEKDKKIAELEKQLIEQKEEIKKWKEDDLFDKKQKCLGYKNEIEKDLKDKEAKDWEWVYTLEQVFYSISKNECYFVSVKEEWKVTDRWLYKYWNHSWHSPSENICYYYDQDDFSKIDEWCSELDKKIKELKWE